jgi:hypothetical protein
MPWVLRCYRSLWPVMAKVPADALEDSQRILGKFLRRLAGRIVLPFSRTRGRFCTAHELRRHVCAANQGVQGHDLIVWWVGTPFADGSIMVALL